MAWSEATRALVPPIPRLGRPRATDPRRVFDGVRSLLSSGCRWHLVSPCHPPFSAVRNCFDARRNDDPPERRLDALRDRAGCMLPSHASGRTKAISLINHVQSLIRQTLTSHATS